MSYRILGMQKSVPSNKWVTELPKKDLARLRLFQSGEGQFQRN